MPPTCQNTVCLCQVKFETCYWITHRNFSLYSFLCLFLRKSGSGKSHEYQTFLGEYSIQVYLHIGNLNYASKIQTRKWIRRHFLVCFLFFCGNFFVRLVESYLCFYGNKGKLFAFLSLGYTFLQLKFICWELVFLKTVKGLNPGVISLVGWVWSSRWT